MNAGLGWWPLLFLIKKRTFSVVFYHSSTFLGGIRCAWFNLDDDVIYIQVGDCVHATHKRPRQVTIHGVKGNITLTQLLHYHFLNSLIRFRPHMCYTIYIDRMNCVRCLYDLWPAFLSESVTCRNQTVAKPNGSNSCFRPLVWSGYDIQSCRQIACEVIERYLSKMGQRYREPPSRDLRIWEWHLCN